MKNTIEACVEFDFKGQHHELCIDLDLDQAMETAGALPPMHALVARHNHIDTYSYEYEMMQAETIKYSSSHPLVDEHIIESLLDIVAFETSWHEYRQLEECQKIAEKYLSINDLQQYPELKYALLEAYRLGAKND